MIIWLASYPKSGNTWMRTMVSSLLHSDDGVFDFTLIKKIDQFPEKKFFRDFVKDFRNFNEIKENWIAAQDKVNLDKKIKLFYKKSELIKISKFLWYYQTCNIQKYLRKYQN